MSSSNRRRVDFSQNFLRNPSLVNSLVERSSIGHDDIVVEIGAGKGIITEALAHHCRQVLTIEKDPRLAEMTRRRFIGQSTVIVFACDILDFPLPQTPFKVFASIPFRITTAIVAKLTSGLAPPIDAYMVVQREAAIKFAGVGGKSMLSITSEPWFDISIEHVFRRSDFSPRPSVDSVLMRMSKRPDPLLAWDKRDRFEHLVEAAFSAWQPTVEHALRILLPHGIQRSVLRQVGGSLSRRPSELYVDTWLEVFHELERHDDAATWRSLAQASAKLRSQQVRLERPTRTKTRASQSDRREERRR